jgi:hypothetical protein
VWVWAVVLVFAATVKVTDPGPVRPVPFWNVRRLLLPLLALQAQPAWVVTLTVPLVPAAGALLLVGLIEYVQDAAACDTVMVCPATVPVIVRGVVVALAATVNATDPDAVPPVGLWKVRKLLPLVALQAQPACVVTVTVPLAPVLGAMMLVGLIE